MSKVQQFQRLQAALESGLISRRHFLQTTCALGLGAAASQFLASRVQAALIGPVNYACWATYKIPEVLDGFKKESGVVLNCIDISSDAAVLLKMKQVPGFYDVANPLADFARKAWEEGLIELFDVDAIPHSKDIFPIFRQMPALRVPFGPDKGKFLGFPLEWSASTPLYRADKISPPPDSWAVLTDSKYKGRIAWDARPHYLFPWAAFLLGFEVDKPDHPGVFHLAESELKKVKEELIKWKKLVNPVFASSTGEMAKLFLGNEVDLGYGISAATVVRIKFAGGPPVRQVVLKTGEKRFGWVALEVLAKPSPHREAALAWIAYRSRPEVLIHQFKKVGNPTCVRKVMELAVAQGFAAEVELISGLAPERLVAGMSLAKVPSDVAAWQMATDEVKAA